MVQISQDFLNRIEKEFLLIDIEKREFFVKHIKKSSNVYNPQYDFDDEAILELLKGDLDKILNLFDDKYDRIKVGYVYKNDMVIVGSIDKAKLATSINELYNAGKLENILGIGSLNKALMDLSNPNKANFGEEYTVSIDDKKLSIKTKDLLNFLTNNYKNFDFDKIIEINGINKNEYIYCLKQFIIHSQLLTRYRFSKDSYDFMHNIIDEKIANTMQFNSYRKTFDENLFRTQLNSELIDYINKDMPQNYTPLQKSLYTYIKLCKVLTYDPEFYANNQSGMIARKHREIERLETITPQNSQIVCYEFTQIFAKFLYDLGINYIVDGGVDYGTGHANLSYRAGDYVVEADSVTSILGGDLFNAKVNNALVGLKCKNKNKQAINNFNNICRQVYEDIIEKEDIQNYDEALFDEFLDMLDDLCVKEQVGIEQKVRIFKKQSKDINLPDIEKLTYMLRLSKAIFAEEIDSNQFEAVILSKKSIVDGYNIKSMPTIIFSFNEKSFKTAPEKTTYKTLDEKGQLIDITKESIIKGYNYGFLKNITNGRSDVHTIPGITDEEIANVK